MAESLASGPDDLPSVRAALGRLEAESARLERELTAARGEVVSGVGGGLDEHVEALLRDLRAVRDQLNATTPAVSDARPSMTPA